MLIQLSWRRSLFNPSGRRRRRQDFSRKRRAKTVLRPQYSNRSASRFNTYSPCWSRHVEGVVAWCTTARPDHRLFMKRGTTVIPKAYAKGHTTLLREVAGAVASMVDGYKG